MDLGLTDILYDLAFNVAIILLIVALMCLSWWTRRFSHTEDLPKNCVGMKLSGIVTSVPDGDGFRFFHTPWFRSSKYTQRDPKLSIRLAGIDAPEMRGAIPGQRFAVESKNHLTKLVWKKKVDLKIVGIDRYKRILAYASVPGWFFTTNVNFEMVKKGFACVYTGQDAKYDGQLKELEKLENNAKRKKIGMWKFNSVTPMEHKRIHRLAMNHSSSLMDYLWKKIPFWK